MKREDFSFQKDMAVRELSIGVPMALQYVITGAGMLLIQSSLNLLGTMAVAAYTAGSKIEVFLEQGPIAIGSAMSTYCAQNMGAGKISRIKKGVHAALWQMVLYFAAVGSLTALFGKYASYLFISDSIIGNVDLFLKVVSVTGILLGILCIYRNSVQGMGYGMLSIAGGGIELAARGLVAVVAVHSRTFFSICLGYPAAWLFSAAFFVILYRKIMKKKDVLER